MWTFLAIMCVIFAGSISVKSTEAIGAQAIGMGSIIALIAAAFFAVWMGYGHG